MAVKVKDNTYSGKCQSVRNFNDRKDENMEFVESAY